jgi:hypothetical protein
MKRTTILAAAVVGLLAIQVVPVDRENPPVESEVPATEPERALLRRSCYDCHSNETVWPWYSHVAPVSWLLARDVHHAREHVNFSTWNRYDAEKRKHLLEEVWEEVDEGEMPLFFYVPLHPEAKVGAAEKAVIKAWVERLSGAPPDGEHDAP